jgi:hypothetical protein
MMTREEIMKKLAEIKGTMNNDRPTIVDRTDRVQERIDEPAHNIEEEVVSGPDNTPSDDGYRAIESVVEVESFRPTPELTALAEAWQAEIGETGKLVCNKVDMNRKDYLKHTRTITQEQLLDNPLMYVLFRSEEQPEGNFFHWLERFPRAKP